MNKEKYPKWIDQLAKSYHKAFLGMTPWSWGPVDVFTVMSALNGTFLNKIEKAIQEVKSKKYPMEEIIKCFPSISSFRIAIYYLVIEYQGSKKKDKERFKEIIEFFVNVLEHATEKDLFGYKSNIIHTEKEIKEVLEKTSMEKGSPEIARELGKLYTSAASLVFALYGDFFPQESHEIFGPYKISKDSILTIKHFPKIKPIELWPEIKELKYSDLKILQIFKNVEFECELIGMHSLYKGDLINGLVSYAVMVDGKFINDIERIKGIRNYFAEVATKYSSIYDDMSKEELKKKTLEWNCYQFVYLFKLAGMDWRPTEEMIKTMDGLDVELRSESEDFPSFEEYIKNPEFEIYWLKDLYK